MTAKLSIAALLLAAMVLVPNGAVAQDTIGIYLDDEGDLDRAGITKVGEPFDVVVVANTSQESSAAEFVMTELMHLYAGVFKFSTTKVNDTPLDLGNNQQGEYVMAFAGCQDKGSIEIVRIQYYDVDGSIGDNVVLELSGLGPDASVPSSFGGEMGYIACSPGYGKVILTGVPWEDGDAIDPTRIEGVVETDGILVLNPVGISVPTDAGSISTLKARY